MASELNTLLAEAEVIQTETTENKNDADRIGQMFKDIIAYLGKYQGSSGGEGSTPVDPSSITWEELNAAFLNANAADTANGRITFNRGFDATGPNNVYQQPGGEAGLYIYGHEDADTAPLTVEGTDMDGISIYADGDIVSGATMECMESLSRTSTTHQAVIGPKLGTQTGVALTVNGDSNISGTLTVHDLEVTGAAHFMQLLIDQIKANEGAVIITCANCTVSAVVANGLSRRVYFSAKSSTSAHGFVRGDYVICADFKAAHTGSMTDVSNKYYWTRVQGVSSTPTQTYVDTGDNIDDDGGYYHWIQITTSGADGVVNCAKGDDLIQLGYKAYTGDTPLTGDQLKAHQSAIVLSSYGYLLDKGLGNTPALTPPSLAFYQGIGNAVNGNAFNYNLTPYRTTFMDANGTTIKGAFIAESTLDSGTAQVSVEAYTLKCESNPITAPSSDTKAVEFRVLHTIDGQGTFLNDDTVGDYSVVLYVTVVRNGHNATPEVSFSNGKFIFDIGPNDTKLNADLLFRKDGESDILKDHFTADIVSFDNITDGINGDKIERVYKKVQIGYSTGNLPDQGESWADTTNKNGWAPWDSETHRDEVGYYLYYISRAITFNSANQPQYGNWEGPFRSTGEKGEPGDQGNDGPGFKNIFARITPSEVSSYSSGPTFSGNYPDSPSEFDDEGYYKRDTKLNPKKWYDDPISPIPTADTYISQSTTYTDSNSSRTWSNWSKPALYTLYSEGAIQYKLIALKEAFEVTINKRQGSDGTYEDLEGGLKLDLKYKVAIINGENVTYLDNLTSGFRVRILYNGTANDVSKNYTATIWDGSAVDKQGWATIALEDNAVHQAVATYLSSNLLADAVKPKINNILITDYYALFEAGCSSLLPNIVTVQLFDNSNTIIDTRTIELLFQADGVFMVTKSALTSVYQGLGGSGEYSAEGFSQIKQTWEGIKLSVNNIEKLQDGGSLEDGNLERYVFIRNSNPNFSTAPSGDITSTSTASNVWTKSRLTANSSDKYVHYSKGTRATTSDPWTWTTPKLYAYWSNGQSVQAATVNSAQLKLQADNITSTVNQEIGNLSSEVSRIEQTANSISLELETTGKTNLLYNPGFYEIADGQVYKGPIDYWNKIWHQPQAVMNINDRINIQNKYQDYYPCLWEQMNANYTGDSIRLLCSQNIQYDLPLITGNKLVSIVMVMFAGTMGLADSHFGVEFTSSLTDVLGINPDVYINGSSVTSYSHGATPNQRQFVEFTNTLSLNSGTWYELKIVWTVNSNINTTLNHLTFGLYGYRLINNSVIAANQPRINWAMPQLYLADDSGQVLEQQLSKTGIDIKQGTIHLEGVTTVNDGFSIGLDGSMEANNGTFAGFVRTKMHVVDPSTVLDTLSESTDFVNPENFYTGENQLRPVLCNSGIWCDILKLGSSVVFHSNGKIWDNSRFPILDYTAAIHLPFISANTHGPSNFSNLFHSVYTSDPNDEKLYNEVFYARSFAGCRMEIINLSGGEICLCGVGDSYSAMESPNPWDYYLVYANQMVVLECIREIPTGASSVTSDRVYWKVVGRQENLPNLPISVFNS